MSDARDLPVISENEPQNRPDLVREAQARDADTGPGRDWHATFRSRLGVAIAFVALWAVAIQGRLVYLQVYQHDELVRRADNQSSRIVNLPPERGNIYDRNGHVLAFSVDGAAVYATPSAVQDRVGTVDAICAAVRRCSAETRAEMLVRIRKTSGFQYMWRFASPAEAARVRALKLPGIGFLTEPRRYYPNRELAAHVLGFVDIDNKGLGGIEQKLNAQIAGQPGRALVSVDAKDQAYASYIDRPSTAGISVELTIDRDIQHIVERELEAGVREYGAEGGTVVILEPSTGDVLAMASYPTFNPNLPAREGESRGNPAIQHVYEPGSTFKVVTASAALELGVAGMDEVFDVSQGYIRFGDRRIDDVHRYDALTFKDVIVKSSNVGAIRIGQRVGAERLVDYARQFGFGSPVARDLPGQSRGILYRADRLNDSALASVSMGYQVSVTPVQMAAAVNSIATGGVLMQPRVVRATIERNIRTALPPVELGRSVQPQTAAMMTAIMEAVVENGTAKTAQVPGYTIAGKTGTAAKLENGRYSKSEYNASFVGFVPSRNPALTVLVVIDSPRGKGYYGGTVAAPVFARIAEAALRHMGVPRNVDPGSHLVVTRMDAPEATGVTARPVADRGTSRVTPVLTTGIMPDLRGLGARAAVRTLAQLGMSARVEGHGVVATQEIAPGTAIEPGTTCILRLARTVALTTEARATP